MYGLYLSLEKKSRPLCWPVQGVQIVECDTKSEGGKTIRKKTGRGREEATPGATGSVV